MSTPPPPPTNQGQSENNPLEDKRLERLYDYTKFHIGIYLSSAAGVAALLGSKEAGWIITTLVGNEYLLYLALALLVVAGMCGGIVATSVTESPTFDYFWTTEHCPATITCLKARWKVTRTTWWDATGKTWVGREHGFFWASLLTLALAILIRYPGPPSTKAQVSDTGTQATCCCACQPQPSPSSPKE